MHNATLSLVFTPIGVDVGRLESFGGVDLIVTTTVKEVLAIAKLHGMDLSEVIILFREFQR